MHELPVIESMMKLVIRHANAGNAEKVIGIGLRIGELSDLADEWMQRYFDYVSKGTIAEGAILKIERTPVVLKCEGCGKTFPAELNKKGGNSCPDCGGGRLALVSGREFLIKQIEVI
jgi:hydrogenase nickel incorporation protein HypA/HybF